MPKHRKSTRHRKVAVILAAAVAVGTPSVAFASGDWNDDWRWNGGWSWQDGKDDGSSDEERGQDWRARADRDRADRDWADRKHADRKHSDRDRERGTGHGDSRRWKGGEGSGEGSGKETADRPSAEPSAPGKPASTGGAPSSKPSGGAASPGSGAPGAATPSAPGTSAPTTPAPQATTPASGTPVTASAAVNRVLELVNTERGKVGCAPLKLDPKLTAAAQAHSEDMAKHRNMSHTGSDGSSPSERIRRAGYSAGATGENVAYGYNTPEKVMNGWMTSAGHKRNILDCGYKDIGIGLAQPGNYWTQDFGSPR